MKVITFLKMLPVIGLCLVPYFGTLYCSGVNHTGRLPYVVLFSYHSFCCVCFYIKLHRAWWFYPFYRVLQCVYKKQKKRGGGGGDNLPFGTIYQHWCCITFFISANLNILKKPIPIITLKVTYKIKLERKNISSL